MAIEIVDFPIKNGDFPLQNVSSPEGTSVFLKCLPEGTSSDRSVAEVNVLVRSPSAEKQRIAASAGLVPRV